MRKTFCALVAFTAFFSASAQSGTTLQECLRIGLERNYAVRIVRNNEAISDNNVTLANAGYLPTVGVSAGYTGYLNETRTTDREGELAKLHSDYSQTVNAGVNVSWDLFDGFRVQTNYQRLQELQAMGEINTRITIEDFIAELTAEYYNYIRHQIRLQNYRDAVQLSKERIRIVEARYMIGVFSRLDLLQARVDFNADSSQYMTQQELVHFSRIRLNELMAMPEVNAELPLSDSAIFIDTGLDWYELRNQTLSYNSLLLYYDKNTVLAELDLKTLQSRNYPYVTFGTGYGYTWNRYDTGATLKRHNLGLNAGLTVGMTLFDGNRKREQRNARIEIENARIRREEVEKSIIADLSNFWHAYVNNLQILQLEQDNLIAAKENYEIAMERYLLGDLSGIEMREAQQSLLDAEERILSARYNTKLCEISLKQISGNVLDYYY